MKITTQDIEIYNAIVPLKVAEYLQQQGWHEVKKVSSKVIVWEYRDTSGKIFSVLLPLSAHLPDYASRMYELFRTLYFTAAQNLIL